MIRKNWHFEEKSRENWFNNIEGRRKHLRKVVWYQQKFSINEEGKFGENSSILIIKRVERICMDVILFCFSVREMLSSSGKVREFWKVSVMLNWEIIAFFKNLIVKFAIKRQIISIVWMHESHITTYFGITEKHLYKVPLERVFIISRFDFNHAVIQL